jgi:hypothetical protein
VDLTRLKPVVDGTRGNWEINASLPRSRPTGVPEFPVLEAAFGELRQRASAVTKAQQWFATWHTEMVEWLGTELDKEALVRELKETVDAAKAARMTGDIDVKRLNLTIEAFRTARVVPALDDAAKVVGTPARGLVLSVLGHGHWNTARLGAALKTQYDKFLEAVEQELRGEAERLGADPLAEATAALGDEFNAVGRVLAAMGART